MRRKWRSLRGIRESRHSRRRLATRRSQHEFARGARPGVLSGLAAQTYLEERLQLVSGGQLLQTPFSADLVGYSSHLGADEQGNTTAAACGAFTFTVSPSARASDVLIESGTKSIRLYPYPEHLERGQALGRAGGTLASPDGVEV